MIFTEYFFCLRILVIYLLFLEPFFGRFTLTTPYLWGFWWLKPRHEKRHVKRLRLFDPLFNSKSHKNASFHLKNPRFFHFILFFEFLRRVYNYRTNSLIEVLTQVFFQFYTYLVEKKTIFSWLILKLGFLFDLKKKFPQKKIFFCKPQFVVKSNFYSKRKNKFLNLYIFL